MTGSFEDEEMLEILESYLIETGEILEILTSSLIELENSPDNSDLVNKIFRYFHTIKGTSSFMGFDDIAKLTHSAEDLLNKARRGELSVTQEILDVLMDSRDRLDLMVAGITNPGDKITYDDLVSRILAIQDVESAETNISKSTSKSAGIVIDSDESALEKVFESSDLFQGSGEFSDEELALLEKAFAEVNNSFQSPDLSEQSAQHEKKEPETDKVQINIIEDSKPVSKAETPLPEIEKEFPASPPKAEVSTVNNAAKALASKPASQTETIRIDINRVESLMDLSGELVLGRNRLTQITNKIVAGGNIKELIHELVETTNQIDLITSEVQTSAMKMRMVPIGRLFQKAPKIIRDLSKEFGKKIKLTLEGEDTEVDRGIIEELNDPLVHMLRNSCDHGIETAEERRVSGKNPEGQIQLIAYHEGNHIILKIIDDGKGIDPEKILSKAIEKGFVNQDQLKQLSNWEILQLIFKPGFSTAKNVTAVSGRGVGMDVVKTNINKLKGIIEIDSTPGIGSTFTVKLPLTLAIIQGLLIKSNNSIYALPLSSVVEVVSFDEETVHYVNSGKVIRIRDEVIPLMFLEDITGDNVIENKGSRYVVNLAIGIERVGLVVDELLGQQEIVIKSLGNYLVNIEGIAGSTIIGDGRVIMILDTQGIIKQYKKLRS
ncbi:MAG: chemotaxis protein CheA [Candidatus Kapabacteria bacterium]|nr:chemotaxis protein CheA [Ignavibacteriota bacterium]MCW5884617.1 chemotaxis protein CheA [Candidatus Kapabacteria bacterium]